MRHRNGSHRGSLVTMVRLNAAPGAAQDFPCDQSSKVRQGMQWSRRLNCSLDLYLGGLRQPEVRGSGTQYDWRSDGAESPGENVGGRPFDPRDRAMFLLMLRGGLRVGEVRRMQF